MNAGAVKGVRQGREEELRIPGGRGFPSRVPSQGAAQRNHEKQLGTRPQRTAGAATTTPGRPHSPPLCRPHGGGQGMGRCDTPSSVDNNNASASLQCQHYMTETVE